ncbi:MAG: hypothetical protein FWH04_05715 [Oscillospiraceae bacterium]|nr:hypothetical protein [Oscillospiraceae bacterium]
MGVISNLLWFLLGGLIAAIPWGVADLLLCVTIIGLPFDI